MELNAAMIVSTSDIAISLPTISPVAVPVIVGPTNSVNSTPQPSTLQSHLSNYSISTTPNGSSSVNKADEMVPRAELERLKLEMKLREADNNFLQEELENKDKMLHLLTDGLKEVSYFTIISTYFSI